MTIFSAIENSFTDKDQIQLFLALLAGLNGVNFALALDKFWSRAISLQPKEGLFNQIGRKLGLSIINNKRGENSSQIKEKTSEKEEAVQPVVRWSSGG